MIYHLMTVQIWDQLQMFKINGNVCDIDNSIANLSDVVTSSYQSPNPLEKLLSICLSLMFILPFGFKIQIILNRCKWMQPQNKNYDLQAVDIPFV